MLDELRGIETELADVLVVVWVYSPTFEHEAYPVALTAAIERHQVNHPVLNDPELLTWQAYAVRAWSTLAVVDPEGYVVAQLSGEGHGFAPMVTDTRLANAAPGARPGHGCRSGRPDPAERALHPRRAARRWGIPVVLDAAGAQRCDLDLRGVAGA